MAKKIELLHTTYDESGNIESQEVVHPLTSPDCIIMENGKTLDEVMGDGIATPTLTHEGTSFKVGVGDSNIEVVDGDVAGMTLKGQSYQNILPKPTTLIMETDEKEFKINDKIDSNIIIDDNIAEIATVKGKTIVNAVQEESASEYTVLGEDLSGQSIAHVKETPTLEGQTLVNLVNGYTNHKTQYSPIVSIQPILKPDTKYLIILWNNSTLDRGFYMNEYLFSTWISTKVPALGVYIGINTTKSELITGIDATTLLKNNSDYSNSEISNNFKAVCIEYQEGMENWDIPYFEGTKYFESNIKGVTLQGQTLVNTIQEPCKDDYVVLGADDGIEISAETGGCGTIENTIGGSIKSAILKGCTLVNLQPKAQRESWGVNLNGDIPLNNPYGGFDGVLPKLKPSTKYLIKFSKNISEKYNTTYFSQATVTVGNIVNDYRIVTTLDSLTANTTSIHIYPINNAFSTIGEMYDYLSDLHVMVIEYQDGMENWDIPYFEGMQSVKMPVLTTTGKNLINLKAGHSLTSAYTVSDEMVIITSNQDYRRYIVPLTLEAGTYSLQGECEGGSITIRPNPDGSGNQYANVHGVKTFTLGEKTTVFLALNTGSYIGDVHFKNIQLEKRDKVTSYEPYQSNILTTNEEVELRGIGDFKDELDLQTGKLTQRIGEVVFDGSDDEKWSLDATEPWSNNGEYYTFNIYIQKGISNFNGLVSQTANSKYPNISYSQGRENGIGCFLYSGGGQKIAFRQKNITTLDEWKTHLQANPITVQYRLANEPVKTIDLQVSDQDGNTFPHIQTQPTVTHITASSDYLIPTVTIDNNLAYNTIIKPSTLYTVRFKHDTVNADNPLTVDLGGTTQTVTSTEFTITTPSKLTHNQLVFSGKNNVVSEVQVIEGNVTNIEYPFFEGMNDVQITDTNRNVNLFDINDTVSGYLGATGTEIKVPDHGNLTSNYIKVKPNTTYVYNHGGFVSNFADYWTGMYFYQDDKGTESNLYTNGTFNRFVHTGQGKKYSNFKFTTPSDCEYIRIGSRGLSYDGAWATLYQLDNFSDSKFVGRGKNLLHVSKGLLTTNNYNGLTVIRDEVKQTITVNGTCTTDNTSFGLAPLNMLMKEGKRYILSAELISGTSDKIVFRVNTSDWSSNISCSCESWNNYKNSTAMTFWRDRLYDTSSCRVDSGTTFVNATYRVMLEEKSEGNATTYEPYRGVEVQQDIDSIPLTSDMFKQGAIDNAKAIQGMSLQQIPIQAHNTRLASKALIPVKPNSSYILNHDCYAVKFDKNGGCVISATDTDIVITKDKQFTIPHNIHYIAPCLKVDSGSLSPSDLDSLNLILQELPQEITLRGIGDVKDELDLTRGEYIQRIGEIVLDGSDDEIWRNEENNTTYAICKISLPQNVLGHGDIPSSHIKCDNIMTGVTYKESDGKEQISAYHHNNNNTNTNYSELRICLPISYLPSVTVQDFRNYIKNHPFKVQYQLETPIIHKVNLTNTKVIPSYATETHYETIAPSDSLIPNITIPSTLNYDVAIKPSTKYTIRANTSDNLTVDLGGVTGTLSNGKVTLTTPATLTHNEVKFSGTGKVKELMVVEGNEIKDNVPFFNGMKDVQMGGIKLVNVCRGMYTWNADFITLNTNYNQFTFTDAGFYGNIEFDPTLLKPNTTYTVYYNVTENTSTITSPIGTILSQTNGKETYTYPIMSAKQTGITKFTMVTDGVAKEPRFVVKSGSTNSKITVKNIMIIEGDWTHLDEIPFIESEMIIDQPIIRSQGKNLFDISRGINYAWHSEYAINGDGSVSVMPTLVNGVAYVQSEFFFLEVGKTYTVSWNASGNVHANFVWLAGTTNSPYGTSNTFTVVEGKNKLTLAMYVDTSSLENVATFKPQIQEHTTAASYEPYKHQTLYSNRVIGYEKGVVYEWSNGSKFSNTNMGTIAADVEGLSVAYVSTVSSHYSFWDKDGVFISGKQYLDSSLSMSDKNGFIAVPSNAKYMKCCCINGIETEVAVTGELPLRSLPNGVCDTLNLVTGEYVQRVGEIVLDGSEVWGLNNTNSKTACYHLAKGHNLQLLSNMKFNTNSMLCNRYAQIMQGAANLSNNEGIFALSSYEAIYINSNIMSTNGSNDFKQYLSQNPITVQYELATPIVRKLGFTTKGNYREQVLDGSETWAMDAIDNNKTVRMTKKTTSPLQNPLYDTVLFTDDYHVRAKSENHATYEYIACIGNGIYINIYQSKVKELSVQGCTQWLSQNPIKVGYITSTQSSESYSNIHKPIFFNNINVQFLPQNIDIQPQLTLQARTRNSYVMDMMKANTKYSMKLLTSSGNMKIDGTSYALANNRTFISPSTLTNKELIISGQWYEPMIIEGDVTGKNLPYFKGILSSYHDVDEIEVYSVNKNLFDINNLVRINSASHVNVIGNSITFNCTSSFLGCGDCWIPVEIGENYTISLGQIIGSVGASGARIEVRFYNSLPTPIESATLSNQVGNALTTRNKITTTALAKYMRITISNGQDDVNNEVTIINIQVEKSSSATSYIPHSHNTTLIEMPTRLETVKVVRPELENGSINFGTGANYDDGDSLVKNVRTKDYLPVQPGEIIKFYNNGQGRAVNMNYYDINKQFIKYEFYDGTSTRPTVPKDCYFVRMYCGKSACSDITLIRQAYKPIQLNSLPNGVCDEIIMKPNSNKAQLVQRVGKVVLDGSASYFSHDINSNTYCQWYTDLPNAFAAYVFSDTLPTFTERTGMLGRGISGKGGTGYYVWFNIESAIATTESAIKAYLQQNPITAYYELATPIIHEIQLKGYPHVYENGTVTLNTDTPHQTLVSYNVNQEQLINTQNETIIRHDQQIDDLYYYIEMYLEEIYQMELFRMKLELSL